MHRKVEVFLAPRSDTNTPSDRLVDVHVYIVPLDKWIPFRKLARNQVVEETVSAGYIRVIPELTLLSVRDELRRQLGTDMPDDFVFIKSVGRNFTQVKAHQEEVVKIKSFIPPHSVDPEIHVLELSNELMKQHPSLSNLIVSDTDHSEGQTMGLMSPDNLTFRAEENEQMADDERNQVFTETISSEARLTIDADSNLLNDHQVHTEKRDNGVRNMTNIFAHLQTGKHHDIDEDYDGMGDGKVSRERDGRIGKEMDGNVGRENDGNISNEKDEKILEENFRKIGRERNGKIGYDKMQEKDEKLRKEINGEKDRKTEDYIGKNGGKIGRGKEGDKYNEVTNLKSKIFTKRKMKPANRLNTNRNENISDDKMDSTQQQNTNVDACKKLMNEIKLKMNNGLESEEKENQLKNRLDEVIQEKQLAEELRQKLLQQTRCIQEKIQLIKDTRREHWWDEFSGVRKIGVDLEEKQGALRYELDVYHRKIIGSMIRNIGHHQDHLVTGVRDEPSRRANYKISIIRLRHEVEDLRRRVEAMNIKVEAEVKLRNNADHEVKQIRSEVSRKKTSVTLCHSRQQIRTF